MRQRASASDARGPRHSTSSHPDRSLHRIHALGTVGAWASLAHRVTVNTLSLLVAALPVPVSLSLVSLSLSPLASEAYLSRLRRRHNRFLPVSRLHKAPKGVALLLKAARWWFRRRGHPQRHRWPPRQARAALSATRPRHEHERALARRPPAVRPAHVSSMPSSPRMGGASSWPVPKRRSPMSPMPGITGAAVLRSMRPT